MKSALLTFALLFAAVHLWGANVRIIESQSFNSGHAMDVVWQSVATGMGHTVTISPQTTLDNTAFFGSTDVLIVASGVISLSATRVSTIQQFVQTGKPVYIQSEYLCNYTSNTAYSSIVNALGGSIAWGNTTAGTLAPMNVLGSMATTPNAVAPLTYYWYGCYGTPGGTVQSFLTFGGLQYGFMFCPPSAGVGRMATTTDQDWVNQSTSLPLMRNILAHLLTPISCSPPLNEVHLDLKATPTSTGKIELNWRTEVVNQEGFPALFELWRSVDGGMDFTLVYQTMDPKIATYLDEPALIGAPVFYQLRVVDGDGREFYSETVQATVEKVPGLLEMEAYLQPQLGTMVLNLNLRSGESQSAMVELLDLQSKLIWQEAINLLAGDEKHSFNLPDLAPGMYLLRLKTSSESRVQKIMIR